MEVRVQDYEYVIGQVIGRMHIRQDAFLKTYADLLSVGYLGLCKAKAGYAKFRNTLSFSTWAYRNVYQAFCEYLPLQAGFNRYNVRGCRDIVFSQTGENDVMCEQEFSVLDLQLLLSSIPDGREKECFVKTRIWDLDRRAVAAEMGVKPHTVSTYSGYVLAKLREIADA